MNKLVLPPPSPSRLPEVRALKQTIEDFLLKGESRAEKIVRTKILNALKGGLPWNPRDKEEKGVKVWTGSAYQEGGLCFRRMPVTTVMELMFVDRDDIKRIRDLGGESRQYLDLKLQEYGLWIGMAVPPNDYD